MLETKNQVQISVLRLRPSRDFPQFHRCPLQLEKGTPGQELRKVQGIVKVVCHSAFWLVFRVVFFALSGLGSGSASSAPQPGSLELKIRGGGGGPGGSILRKNRVRVLGWTDSTQVGILRDRRWEPPPYTHIPALGLGFLLCGRLCNELGPSHSFNYLASVCLSFLKCIKGESIPSPQ